MVRWFSTYALLFIAIFILFGIIGIIGAVGALLYVSLFYVLLWVSSLLALPEVLKVFLAIFIPFGIIGAVLGLLDSEGESFRVAALRGARRRPADRRTAPPGLFALR